MPQDHPTRQPSSPEERRPDLVPIATALRDTLRTGYGLDSLRRDVVAGLVVGIVALPLSMALAIATGVGPHQGLVTAIVAGAVVALAGGSRVQVSGPTAAFVVILAPVVAEHGPGGLMLATMLAAVLLLLMGIFRLGRAVRLVPHSVVTGFTAGIAIVIGLLQLRDLLGIRTDAAPVQLIPRLVAWSEALPTASWGDAAIALLTFAILLGLPRLLPRVPSALVAVAAGALAVLALERWVPGFSAVTISDRFGTAAVPSGIPQGLPQFAWPWNEPGADGAPVGVSLELLRELAPAAFAIALLGALESLLSAVVSDGMTGRRHDPDGELIGQGLGNLASPLFGGIAATGAIARTAVNVRSGAVSPIASLVHSLFLLSAIVLLAPWLGTLPMASLAALLVIVAWRMGDFGHVARMIRDAPRGDAAVMLSCMLLTVAFDMIVSITVGLAMASLIFIRRMSEASTVTLVSPEDPAGPVEPLPSGVVLYRVGGPLFFGAAAKAMRELERIERMRLVILDLRGVPFIDSTGLVNLEATISSLARGGTAVAIVGLEPRPTEVLARATPQWRDQPRIFRRVEDALAALRS